MYILILAGGQGTRLWPASRKNQPKQILEIFGREPLILQTWARLRKQYAARNIFISADRESAVYIKKKIKDLPPHNLIIESAPRGTAAAIGYGAYYISRKVGSVPVAVISSDASIGNEQSYLMALRQIEQTLKKYKNKTVLLGIKPKYAETGYGYIKIRNPKSEIPALSLSNGRNPELFPERSRGARSSIFEVEKFIEKPSLKRARHFVKSGKYLWNPGIFGWNSGYLADLYRKYLPKTYGALAGGEFNKTDKTSVDYGILEKEKNALVIPADFGWADIGHWRTVHEILRGRPDDNVVRGKHIQVDSSGNLIYSSTGRLIATAGLRDTVIIETDDAILVCPRERSQDVKKLTEILKKNGLARYL
jgi:mannose-1-phosphate guanylyltransferase